MAKKTILEAAHAENAFTFSDAKHPNGTHVAVGFYPTKLMVNTTTGWTYVTPELGQQMVDIIWVAKLSAMFAFGMGPDIYKSVDGLTWTKIQGPNVKWRNVCVDQAGPDIVGITDTSIIHTRDMITFTESVAPTPPSAIGYVAALGWFVLAGPTPKGADYPALFTSINGLTYTEVLT